LIDNVTAPALCISGTAFARKTAPTVH
jgi:hypothetical protein